MSAIGLKIGLIGPLPPPSGGMANQTHQLAVLLRAEGAIVELVQVNPPYPGWIANVRWLRAPFRLLPYLVRVWRAAGKVHLFHVMANSGWSWHLTAAPAIWLGKLRGVPVILNYRGGGAEEFFARSFYLVKLSLLRADAVVVPSGFLERVFAKHHVSVRVVPNIVDFTRFSAGPTRERHCANESPHIIVSRNLEPIYDIATAIRAFALLRGRLPKARLTVAGSGPERAKLEAIATTLGVASSVTFTGRLDNANMADLYRAATMMVNPSLVDNMPISILESMACGVPVVSTNVGGVPYVVRHGETGLLFPPASPQAMADAMIRIATDDVLAHSLVQAGQAEVHAYTWANVRDQLLGVYASVIGSARRLNAEKA